MSDTASPTQSIYLSQAQDVTFESSNEKSHRNCPVSGIIQAKSALATNPKNDRSDLATTVFEGEKSKDCTRLPTQSTQYGGIAKSLCLNSTTIFQILTYIGWVLPQN